MVKAHPLTKLQFLLAILWIIPSCILIYANESQELIWFFLSMVPCIGFSVITIRLGWLMAVKKEMVIYPPHILTFKLTRMIRGKQAARNYISGFSKPINKIGLGSLNLVSGVLCLIAAITGIVFELCAIW